MLTRCNTDLLQPWIYVHHSSSQLIPLNSRCALPLQAENKVCLYLGDRVDIRVVKGTSLVDEKNERREFILVFP